MFTAIQNIQCSIFLLAINHMATNAAAVVKVSKYGIAFLNSVILPDVNLSHA